MHKNLLTMMVFTILTLTISGCSSTGSKSGKGSAAAKNDSKSKSYTHETLREVKDVYHSMKIVKHVASNSEDLYLDSKSGIFMEYKYDQLLKVEQIPSPKAQVYVVSGLSLSSCNADQPYLVNMFYVRNSKLGDTNLNYCTDEVPFAVASDKGDKFVLFTAFTSQDAAVIEVNSSFKASNTTFRRVKEKQYSLLSDYKKKSRKSAEALMSKTDVEGLSQHSVTMLEKAKTENQTIDHSYQIRETGPLKLI